jgi:homoserine kinase
MTSENPISLQTIIQAEINDLITISAGYQAKVNTSKTSLKKEYFLKKLKKNNEKLFEMLVALNQHNKNKKENHDNDKLAESDI